MQLTSVLDRPSSAEAWQAQDLLVLWQHPDSRQIIPIGRFGHDTGSYTFAYTRAAAEIEGFRPLPGMRDLRRRYVSGRMPAVFDQRVMESDRPDYAAYLASLGLDPAAASPWEQIVRSGGARAGDTLQFMRVPVVSEGRARARFFANGVRHIASSEHRMSGRRVSVSAEEQEAALCSLSAGDVVSIEVEDGNRVDPCACLITVDSVPVGWVPQALSPGLRQLLERGPVTATVLRVGAPGSPPHLRLVVDLNVAAPHDFQFDAEGWWEPLAPQ